MIRALLYLQLHSSWNRLRSRVKRLKKPKYLAGFLVGGLYFYFYFFRHFLFGRKPSGHSVPELTPALLAGFELLGALALLGLVLLKWVLPHRRVALAFSEAEVSFLFPAPVDRPTLIHFKLLKSQAAILFTTLFLVFLSNRFGQSGGAWIHLAGWWIVLSTLNLHFLGASFARSRWLESGLSSWQRRLMILLLLAVLLGAIVLWARQTIPVPTKTDWLSGHALWNYARQALESGPAPYLLYPFRLVVRPFFAQNVTAFFGALWPALALLVLHYFWVVRSDVAFEEASADLARRRAEWITAPRAGNQRSRTRRPRPAPFVLRPSGPPAVALLWKNLIGARSIFSYPMWILFAIACGLTSVLVPFARPDGARPVMGMFVGLGLVWSVLAGPQLLRQDFRQDLRVADVLKSYPLSGWNVVLGELLAPAVILALVQWFLLGIGVILVSRGPDGTPVTLPARLSVGCGAATILPMLNLVSLLLPNAAVLLFPAWFQAGPDGAQGIEATGQRLIFALGQMLVFLVALLPAAVVFAIVFFVTRLALNWLAAVPLASAAATVMLLAEVSAGIAALGRIFERFDLSTEPPP